MLCFAVFVSTRLSICQVLNWKFHHTCVACFYWVVESFFVIRIGLVWSICFQFIFPFFSFFYRISVSLHTFFYKNKEAGKYFYDILKDVHFIHLIFYSLHVVTIIKAWSYREHVDDKSLFVILLINLIWRRALLFSRLIMLIVLFPNKRLHTRV